MIEPACLSHPHIPMQEFPYPALAIPSHQVWWRYWAQSFFASLTQQGLASSNVHVHAPPPSYCVDRVLASSATNVSLHI